MYVALCAILVEGISGLMLWDIYVGSQIVFMEIIYGKNGSTKVRVPWNFLFRFVMGLILKQTLTVKATNFNNLAYRKKLNGF